MKTQRHFCAAAFLCAILFLFSCNTEKPFTIGNASVRVQIAGSERELIVLSIPGSSALRIKPPVFEIDGVIRKGVLRNIHQIGDPVNLRNKAVEYVFAGELAELPDAELRIIIRIPESNPVVRFRYVLSSAKAHGLTKKMGADNLQYFSASFSGLENVKEIRFSEFNEMVHSFSLSERVMEKQHFDDSISAMGPLMVAGNGSYSVVLGYEHGSQVPDAFLHYQLNPDMTVSLEAVKGNYYAGEVFSSEKPFSTVWLEAAIVSGDEQNLASVYRSFVLNDMTENLESRKPYIFYNTWNYQERMKHWYKKPYLDSMNQRRMTREIDVAHRMGIEVFVIDAGWFEKTGDWQPSPTRFPDGLKDVKAQLDSYGMKLGLWFNPTVAAQSSNMYNEHLNCARTMNGDKGQPWKVWETEESYGMCLVSPYKEAFADKLIQLNRELGVTYFKWDAIGQYECNDPGHFHGDSTNTPQERLDKYAFEIGRAMNYVVDKLAKASPEAIVDFDITEGARTVGLGFLASGKYFLINNGPYYFNYDIPFDRDKDNWNIFFFPGPARGWICRTPLQYDKWFPSVLFLTHYIPDDPIANQSICLGSLMLGQNGIWGDLPAISDEGVAYFNQVLGYYKQVRDDITLSSLKSDGVVGGSPEVYEKVNPSNGKGLIVMFSSHRGDYTYITKVKPNSTIWHNKGVDVTFLNDGYAKISARFDGADAKIVFFGVE